MKGHIPAARLYILLLFVVLFLAVVVWRMFDLTWNRHDWYALQAQNQASGGTTLLRGGIYLRDPEGDFLAAVNRKFPALIMVPSLVDQAGLPDLAAKLSAITGGTPDQFIKAATSGISGSRTVIRHLSDDQAAQIRQLDAQGVDVGYETDRSYPAGTLAADVIGFLGYDQTGRHGQYGVEASYEAELSGQDTSVSVLGSGNPFHWLTGLVKGSPESADTDQTDDKPKDIILTIDKNIQAYAQAALDGVLKKYHASSGVLLVQEPRTGRLLAMADSPSFDPNSYASAPVAAFANGAIQAFEPGSSFKPFTMAAGLDLKKITPETTFDDVNDIVVDGYTIKNFNEKHFGRVTMTTVLEKSINAGTMYVESLLTNDQFLNYVINSGFGQKTGIDLPGEASGNIGNLYSGRRINFLTASFGQGISVTPLQLINGYSAIANGGKLMRPYVVAGVRDDHGVVTETVPEVIGTPFSEKTAATLRGMLTSVVDKGFDKARIPRYDVAGKTGTAQIADTTNGGYLESQYNHSFVGFAPASDPRFVVLVKMERPQGITFAADSLSPVFKDVASFLLRYLNVPPTR